MKTYEEPGYANERLVGTIVRVKGKAVKITGIDPGGAVSFTYIVAGKRDMCMLNDLDITPVPLGFCNYNGSTSYLSRSPVRQDWKQGLRNKTLRSSNERWGVDDIPFKVIGQTIENTYPSLEAVIGHLQDPRVTDMAWCRDFSLNNENIISYKVFGEIGRFVSTKERRFQLNDNYRWVQEALEEVINA